MHRKRVEGEKSRLFIECKKEGLNKLPVRLNTLPVGGKQQADTIQSLIVSSITRDQ